MTGPGRPTLFTEELAGKILGRIAEGESVRSIAKDDAMPCMTTLFAWLNQHEHFRTAYEFAKQESADVYADKITYVADETLAGNYEPQAARVAIDAFKWTSSKLKPKKYGDKVQQEISGPDGKPIEHQVNTITFNPVGNDAGQD